MWDELVISLKKGFRSNYVLYISVSEFNFMCYIVPFSLLQNNEELQKLNGPKMGTIDDNLVNEKKLLENMKLYELKGNGMCSL